MSKSPARKPRPYVYLFQLGSGAKSGKKRVPAAFTKAPCYYHRADQKKFGRKLDAIDEPDVDDRDVEVTFAAIDAMVERCELRAELYTDAEIEADGEHEETRGFHAGASFEEAEEALVKGGFVICRFVDPLAIPRVELTPEEEVRRAVEDLHRHLDLTSLSLVLDRIERAAELPLHAGQAESLAARMVSGSLGAAFSAAFLSRLPDLHPELRDTLLLVVGDALAREPSEALRRFLAALPPAADAKVGRRLERWKLLPGGAPAPGPADVPPAKSAKAASGGAPRPVKKASDVGARIARIEAAAKKAGVHLPGGASESALAAAEKELGVTFPDEVRAFYRAHDGGPAGAPVCSNRELLSLEGMIRQWKMYKAAYDRGELEDDDAEPDEGVQQAWWIPSWIPVTYEYGGNHDVLDLAPDEGGKLGQIVAVWHDDSARSIEGDSFLTWLEEQTWGAPE